MIFRNNGGAGPGCPALNDEFLYLEFFAVVCELSKIDRLLKKHNNSSLKSFLLLYYKKKKLRFEVLSFLIREHGGEVYSFL